MGCGGPGPPPGVAAEGTSVSRGAELLPGAVPGRISSDRTAGRKVGALWV